MPRGRRRPSKAAGTRKKAPGPTAEERAAWALLWPEKAAQGWFMDAQGYIARMVRVNGKRKYLREHRVVMEQMLGRPLRKGENVHHRNGNRAANSPDNLELWVTAQPAGQRPEELVAYALEILALYGDGIAA